MSIAKQMIKTISHLLPDKQYIQVAYFRKFGRFPNLKNPQTFNEKLQWLKLYDRKPEYTTMVDKYEAKKYVASIIGEEYIIPTLGVWDKFEDIDFEELPNQFVLKCTHDSGGLVICRDKSKLDIEATRKKINGSLKHNYYWGGREWPYKNVKPRIIAEQYMEDNQTHDLWDYKYFCFHGEPKMLYISKGLEHHPTAQISFYDIQGNEMPFHRSDYAPFHEVPMPNNYDEMAIIASRIANKISSPFARIDLYSICGKTYFSEITFTPCGGMIPFEPIEWDRSIGCWLDIK
jgi:hypothetical protein